MKIFDNVKKKQNKNDSFAQSPKGNHRSNKKYQKNIENWVMAMETNKGIDIVWHGITVSNIIIVQVNK